MNDIGVRCSLRGKAGAAQTAFANGELLYVSRARVRTKQYIVLNVPHQQLKSKYLLTLTS